MTELIKYLLKQVFNISLMFWALLYNCTKFWYHDESLGRNETAVFPSDRAAECRKAELEERGKQGGRVREAQAVVSFRLLLNADWLV